METFQVLEVECIDRGVLVIFNDGTGALFSAAFLHGQLESANEVVRNLGTSLLVRDAA